MKMYAKRVYRPCFLDLGIRWSRLVSFTPLQVYPPAERAPPPLTVKRVAQNILDWFYWPLIILDYDSQSLVLPPHTAVHSSIARVFIGFWNSWNSSY
jgi:hypothetical protein